VITVSGKPNHWLIKHRNPQSDLFVPDGAPVDAALARTTHLGIGAHQDDLEFFAVHGILECFGKKDRWFTGVTVTDGAGSVRGGIYERFTDQEMVRVRAVEQRKAAGIGEYGAMVQLGFSSAEVKGPDCGETVEDLYQILDATRPEVVYLHNPADKHDTHIAVLTRCVEAIRRMPEAVQPTTVYGCELWRDLDWVTDQRKVALPVSDKTNLQTALIGVFDSQISGGKRYDLAVMSRRLAHATFHESHIVDAEAGLTLAIDLTPVCREGGPSLETFSMELLDEVKCDVLRRIRQFGDCCRLSDGENQLWPG